jgi:tetratricopeptide (TPR) repeat protein
VEDDALALFTRAQRERVQGDTASAIRDFRMVVAKFPSARESALANAELGRLLLDRGEATSALESFGAYLATSDTVLREDVLGARALALRKLGRFEAERAAWELVLREYPSGVYAPRARSRLEELGH